MCIKSQILKEILKFVAPVMHFHFCQKYECLGAKNVVLHRPSVHFGLGTVSCGNALLPSGHNVTSTNTGEAATIRQPEEHPGRLMAIYFVDSPRRGPFLPNFPNALYSPPKTCKFPPGGPCGPRLRITELDQGERKALLGSYYVPDIEGKNYFSFLYTCLNKFGAVFFVCFCFRGLRRVGMSYKG